ncbi:MAG: AMP-binding protein [Deltaproteobacteria bacterium]|nr:AMP-binding protein [Deltaproteobacteria bacterium]
MRVNHFLERSSERLPRKVALVCGEQRWTYEEINNAADGLAASLVEMNVKRQDRVAIFLDNSFESVVSIFGAMKAGAVFMVLNPTLKAGKLNLILRDSGARAVITQTNKARILKEALPELPELEHIILCYEEHEDQRRFMAIPQTQSRAVVSWSSLLEHGSPTVLPAADTDSDLAALIYTSGSTGEPKGVMSAHHNVVAAVESITTYLENVEEDIVLDVLPLSFDYGLYQVLMAFYFGGTVILEKSFAYPFRTVERLVEERVTGFPIVPSMAAILLRMENLNRSDFSFLRYVTNTAAALPVEHIRKLRTLFPHAKIYSMFGLTECKRVSYLPPDQLDRRPESVGIPMPNTEVFIVDGEGQELGPGKVGELVIRGPNVMQGYWNAPEDTARTFRPGKKPGEILLYSGDLFRKDEEGFLYFVGRKDDLIKTMGERVSPKEIENVLCKMPEVSEAAVIGVPDEVAGQAIKAFIIPMKSVRLAEKEILKHCRNHLEPFMVPKYVEFLPALPKSAHGKIDKSKLSRNCVTGIDPSGEGG